MFHGFQGELFGLDEVLLVYGQKVQEVTYELVSGRRVRVRCVDLSVEPGEIQAQVCRLFSWGGGKEVPSENMSWNRGEK